MLIADPDASEDSLYPKKLIYEPSALLAKGTNFSNITARSENVVINASSAMLVKKIDFSRFVRLVQCEGNEAGMSG